MPGLDESDPVFLNALALCERMGWWIEDVLEMPALLFDQVCLALEGLDRARDEAKVKAKARKRG